MNLGETCEKHNKEIQAYCDNDYLLLCIDCVLEQGKHRSHRVESLPDAVKRVRRVLDVHASGLRKAEQGYCLAGQKADDFRRSFEAFKVRITNRIRYSHLKTLQIVSEAFSELIVRTSQKLEQVVASANKVFSKNEEELSAIQRLRQELESQLTHREDNHLSFLRYYIGQFVKYDIERFTKRMQPNADAWNAKDTFNEQLFLYPEMSKTMERIKLDLSIRPHREHSKSASNFASKKEFVPSDISQIAPEDNVTVTNDQLATVAEGFKNILKRTSLLSFVVTSNDLKFTHQDTMARISPDLSETRRRQTSPLNSFMKIKPPSDPFLKLNKRDSTSARFIGSKVLAAQPSDRKAQSIRDLLNPVVPERVVIVGGKKSKNFSLKFFDFESLALESKRVSFPPVKKLGIAYVNRSLYIFGGKVNGKATDKIYRYNPLTLTLDEQSAFTLSRKKYNFAQVQVEDEVCLLFGGKDENGFVIRDIERLDFRSKSAKVIGRLPVAKCGLCAVKVEADFGQPPVPASDKQKASPQPAPTNAFDPGESNAILQDDSKLISFNVSELDQKIATLPNLNFSFDQIKVEDAPGTIRPSMEADLMSAHEQENDTVEVCEYSLELESQLIHDANETAEDYNILLIGGMSGSKYISATVDIYSPRKRKCFAFSELVESRKAFCAIKSDQGVYVFGGRSASGLLKSIEKVFRKKCKIVGSMSVEREGFKGVYRRNEFLLIGGEGYKGTLDIIEYLSLHHTGVKSEKKVQCAPSLSFYELLRVDFAEL